MDDLEKLMSRYRPVGPPPGLRNRVVKSASRERLQERLGWSREWRSAIAAAIVAALFLWMAANERQRIATHVPPLTDDAAMIVVMAQ